MCVGGEEGGRTVRLLDVQDGVEPSEGEGKIGVRSFSFLFLRHRIGVIFFFSIKSFIHQIAFWAPPPAAVPVFLSNIPIRPRLAAVRLSARTDEAAQPTSRASRAAGKSFFYSVYTCKLCHVDSQAHSAKQE